MFLKLYFIALPIFFLIDMVWLGLVARGFYAKHIGFLMRDQVNWIAAIAFYLLFIAGLVFFVLAPALEKQSWQLAVFSGAFFGFITYATYDLTNFATIKNWPLTVTLVDLLWGTVLGALVSGIAYLVAKKFGL